MSTTQMFLYADCYPWLTSLSHSQCDLAAHFYQLCGSKKKKKIGHCIVTKRHSLQIQQLKEVGAPVVSSAHGKLVFAVCWCQDQTEQQSNTSSNSSPPGTV